MLPPGIDHSRRRREVADFRDNHGVPAPLGPVDLVLFCVKLWDVETAGNHIRPLIGGETVVIPLQNGIDASERLAPILGAAHVLGGVALVNGSIIAPGRCPTNRHSKRHRLRRTRRSNNRAH
jgi:ketopantoate reductase